MQGWHNLIARGHARNPAHIVWACDQGKYMRSYNGTKTAGYGEFQTSWITDIMWVFGWTCMVLNACLYISVQKTP